MRTPLLLAILVCALLAVGCGTTTINEHRTYLARTPETGEFSFFRVSIQGHAELAAVKYSAGWQKAEAVDELFKNVLAPPGSTASDLLAPVREAQTKAMADLSKELQTKLAKPLDTENTKAIQDLERRMVQALSLERRLQSRQNSDVPEAPAEKFVVVVSADPEKVFGQIAEVVERQRNEGAVIKTIQALQSKKEGNATAEDQARRIFWSQIEARLPSLRQTVAADADEAAVSAALATARANLAVYRQALIDFLEVAP